MRGNPVIIAVDGPAGSGKSSVCSHLARQLGWTYVNTGAIYRAVGLILHDKGLDLCDERALSDALSGFIEDLTWDATNFKLYYAGADLTERLHSAEAGQSASLVARMPAVRARLLDLQRRLALQAQRGAVVDGRDIGTVIFPDADLKIFLTASLEERARRRHAQLSHKELDEIKHAIAKRDDQDSSRDAAPMRVAHDAVEVDTTGLGIPEVVERLVTLIKERGLSHP